MLTPEQLEAFRAQCLSEDPYVLGPDVADVLSILDHADTVQRKLDAVQSYAGVMERGLRRLGEVYSASAGRHLLAGRGVSTLTGVDAGQYAWSVLREAGLL